MAQPAKIDCHLARDLMVPYLAGDVSETTRQWLTHHLDGCPDCREALGQLSVGEELAPTPPPLPSDETGRRLLRRVRWKWTLLVGALGLTLLATFGLGLYTMDLLYRLADVPSVHHVPPAAMEPAAFAEHVDLSLLGLDAPDIQPIDHGVEATYTDAAGHRIRVAYRRLPTPGEAREAFDVWEGSFRVQLMAFSSAVGDGELSKFRSGSTYYYGWRKDRWFILIQVPASAEDPASLRDAIRDRIMAVAQNAS